MAIVAEGPKGRIYAAPMRYIMLLLKLMSPNGNQRIRSQGVVIFSCKPYGIDRFEQLFSNRQLNALNTFSDLMKHLRKGFLMTLYDRDEQ